MNKVIQQIKEEIDATKAQIEVAKNGEDYTICLNNSEQKQYVLSKYNPKSNAYQLVQGNTFNKQTLWIIVGFMFGYPIEEIVAQAGTDAKVIIVEPNIELLKKQLEQFDNSQFKKCNNISVLGGVAFEEIRETYENLIDASNYHNINTIIPMAYKKMYPLYCKKVVETLSHVLQREVINQNTSKAIYGNVIKNNILNRNAIARSYDLKAQYQKYKDIPAVIVSAGPSLDKNIHQLKGFNGLIFTGGRTLPAVLEQGIEPDFTAVIDSNDVIYETFKDCANMEVPLLAAPQGSHKVVRANRGPQYFVENSKFITKDLLGIELQMLPMAGTVANLCLAGAVYMGCNPIIFIGQDLAYTNMQTHAKSSQVFEREKENAINHKITYIPGYYGEDVPSSEDFISFLNWMQGFIKANSSFTYINATEGGALIEGTVQKTLKEAIAEYNCKEKVHITHEVHIPAPDRDVEQHIKEVLNQVREIHKISSIGRTISMELVDELTLYNGKRGQKIQSLLNKLDVKVDQEIKKYRKRESLTELFETAYNDVKMTELYQGKLNETQEENKQRIAKLNVEIYSSLERSCSMLIEVIEDALKEPVEE